MASIPSSSQQPHYVKDATFSDISDSDTSTAPSPTESQKPLLIIDTDVSTDGVLALMLALTTSDYNVLAITVEKGRWGLDESCDNMLRILKYFGRTEIPVYSGMQPSRWVQRLPKRIFQDEKFVCNFPGHVLPPPTGKVEEEVAHTVLIRLTEQHKGKVSLVTLGPLTNLGMASRFGKSIRHNLKHLYISAGEKRILEGGNSHANFYGDTLSAVHVLEEFSCPMTIVTWEASEAHHVSWDWFHDWMEGEDDASEFIKDCTGHHLQLVRLLHEGDPATRWPGFRSCAMLTMTAMLRPSVVTRRETRSVSVVPRNPRTRGALIPQTDGRDNCSFAVEFDMDTVRKVWEGPVGKVHSRSME